MKAKLKIENFGPIKEMIDLDINKFNIFIGPQGAGKSTISKVLCSINSFAVQYYSKISISNGQTDSLSLFIRAISFYQINSFYTVDSFLFFEDEKFKFELKNGEIVIENKIPIVELFLNIESYYFPAERIALPMIKEALFDLVLNDSSLPKHFLQFGKDFTAAKKKEAKFSVPVLDVQFENLDDKDLVTFNDNIKLLLEETSSAIQALLPMLLVFQNANKQASVTVIEELELHCFPLLQKKLLHHVIRVMNYSTWNRSYVILPTHSPYLLSAINNLLLAEKVGNQDAGTTNNKSYAATKEIIPSGSWIKQDKFSAYYVEKGKATSIVNADGLIDENELDGISEDLADEFDALMSLYKPAIA